MVPICATCQKSMQCKRNGVFVRDERPKVWSADLYQCSGCGAHVLSGFSKIAFEVCEETWVQAMEINAPDAGKQLADAVFDFGVNMMRMQAELAKLRG